MKQTKGRSLDRDEILAAAFTLLEEHGLAGISMRALANKLGIQAASIYWHVSNKDELLGLMAAQILTEARNVPASVEDWRAWLLIYGKRLHEAYTSHRDGAWLCCSAPSPADAADAADAARSVAAPLVRLGVPHDHAIAMQASVISLTLGWSLYQANPRMHEFLSSMMDIGHAYAGGLAALISGFPDIECRTDIAGEQ